MTKAPDSGEVQTVRLSSTFFKAKGMAPETVKPVRDPRSGCERLDARLEASEAAAFSCEVHHGQ